LKTHLKFAVNNRTALVPRDRGTIARYAIGGCKAEGAQGEVQRGCHQETCKLQVKQSNYANSEYELDNPMFSCMLRNQKLT
jgi:hypothetical protein